MRARSAFVTVVIGLWSLCLVSIAGWAQQEEPIIADIVVEGGVTLTLDTVSYYLGLEPGDPLDRDLVIEGFHRLWDSGLFEELRIEQEELEDGTVTLFIIVEERPFVRSVVFEGNKKVTTGTIKDKLDERGVELPRNVPLKLSELSRIETVLGEIYTAEGYRSAEIAYRLEELTKTERRVVFEIQEGGKVTIDSIDFVGNDVFSDRQLRGALKLTKQKSWYRFMGKKILFSEEAWEEDSENLRKYYLNRGYKDAKIGLPEIEVFAKNPDAETLKKQKNRVRITVPVEEGEEFQLGTLKVEGSTVFQPEMLRRVFDVKEGRRYDFKAIEKGMESVQNLYQNRGYIYSYANQVLVDREGEDRIVDVVIDVYEGERFRLRRLEFSGNSVTRDKVLRREFRLAEGDWMSMGSFRRSVFKVNALGYWKLDEDPLQFAFDDQEKTVDVTVKGHEVGRNDIQFGAGYSELDGFFAQVLFNTRNFLGRGNTFGVSLQTGRRSDYYTLSFTEPYFMDRRIVLGASVFSTNLDIADFYRETTGASLTFGVGLGAFDSFTTVLSYEDVTSEYAIIRYSGIGTDTGPHRRPLDIPPAVYEVPERLFEVFAGKTVAITPAYAYDSRDDPFDPNRGLRFASRLRAAGGPLGGDYDYVRPEINFSLFKPVTKKTVLAFNLEAGQFVTYEDSDIPIYERYRLGGDRSLRGLPYYTVVPRTEDGEFFYTEGGSLLGGDRYWLFNLEYQFRVGGPVKIVLFGDVGNTYHEDQGWDFGLWRKTAGIELRVFLPIFQAPIRFIYGVNLDPWPEEDSSDFQFSIGTTF